MAPPSALACLQPHVQTSICPVPAERPGLLANSLNRAVGLETERPPPSSTVTAAKPRRRALTL